MRRVVVAAALAELPEPFSDRHYTSTDRAEFGIL